MNQNWFKQFELLGGVTFLLKVGSAKSKLPSFIDGWSTIYNIYSISIMA